jgi:hypothetical protein
MSARALEMLKWDRTRNLNSGRKPRRATPCRRWSCPTTSTEWCCCRGSRDPLRDAQGTDVTHDPSDDTKGGILRRRLPTTKDALSRVVDLDAKERDQLRLHVQLQRKAMRQENEAELEKFRHEQMVKRWDAGNTTKPNKVIFLSYFKLLWCYKKKKLHRCSDPSHRKRIGGRLCLSK